MGARQSPEMAKAKKLILEKGFSQYAAAAAAGITAGAISKSTWYREHKAALEASAAAAAARAKARARARK